MCRSRILRTLTVVAISILICAAQANAALVKVDLLGGLGEFEFSADTSWQLGHGSWAYGITPATPEDSVASGWYRLTSAGIVPAENTIYKIVPETGLSGSASQYMAIRGAEGTISLRKNITAANDKPSELHTGDRLVFRIDRVYMPECTLPAGCTAQYQMAVNLHTSDPVQPRVTKALPISLTPYGIEMDLDLPEDANIITLGVEMTVRGNPGDAVPGIYIDGARLYRKDADGVTYQTEQVPIPKENRGIKTQQYLCDPRDCDTYAIARDFDAVFLKLEADFPWALRLKYYNPDIKVGHYALAGGVTDYRNTNMEDPYYQNSPLSFATVEENHPEWLYTWPDGLAPSSDNRPDRLKNSLYVFNPSYNLEYYVDMANPAFQSLWKSLVIDKVKRYRLDMVFADAAQVVTPSASTPLQRTAAEVQSFLHAVCPDVRKAEIEFVMNCCIGNLLDGAASCYFDPTWKSSPIAPPVAGYRNNTTLNTPESFFQEWSFFKHWPENGVDKNHYELKHWLMTLDNMDALTYWSKSISWSCPKTMYASVHGVDRPEDPAEGRNGWMHYALCSYLLAQSDYTMLGFSRVGEQGKYIPVDLSATARLDKPMGKRNILEPDGSLQTKAYRNGIVVVNGHPTASRTYTLPRKLITEDNVQLKSKTVITLPPRSGRIFFNK